MNFKTFVVLSIVTVVIASTVASKVNEEKLHKAQQQQIFNAHAEALEMGVLGRAPLGGPRLKLGHRVPPAHSHLKQGRAE